MGVDYTAYVVSGVHKSDIVAEYDEDEEVVRYNELDGSKYIKKVVKTKLLVFGKPATDEQEKIYQTKGFFEFLEHLGLDGWDEFTTGYDDDDPMVGEMIERIKACRSEEISPEVIQQVNYRLTEELKRAGATDLEAFTEVILYAG